MRIRKSFFYLSLSGIFFMAPNVFAHSWQGSLFPQFYEKEKLLYQASQFLEKGYFSLTFYHGEQCYQPQVTVKLNQAISLIPCSDKTQNFRIFKNGTYIAQIDMRSGTPTLRLSLEQKVDEVVKTCPVRNKDAINIDVSDTFKEGERIRDAYSGKVEAVKHGKVTFTPSKESGGLILLESAEHNQSDFDWHNAIVYFALVDRFYNGDPTNDNSYGRRKDNAQEIGTFHGGDLKGLTTKLDYLAELGINAIWISSPLEQMHGWVGGGERGDFPHYAYHGYYHQDWTKIDANMGTEYDLENFIQQAHKRGIRVIFDVVMNHTGYASLADMQEFGFGSLYLKDDETAEILGEKWTDWQPKAGQNWHTFNNFINFSDHESWEKWWGKDWVRSDIGNYDSPKFDDLKMSLSSLPDLKTESEKEVKLPVFFANKQTNAKDLPNAKVRDYLIGWLSDWVRKYGIDGFRVDTAKHVEKSTWLALKTAANKALKEWQTNHPKESFNQPFWMTGEAWGHTVVKSDYFSNGFDAMINFDFQDQAKESLDCFADIAPIYQKMADKLIDFNMLSYLSSHDTRLFFSTDSQRQIDKQRTAANLLMMAPGAVQIYYGDESGREFGPTGSDPIQGTRSDMNWFELETSTDKQALKQHWQKLANFRKKHIAVGKGKQNVSWNTDYIAFRRSYQNDKIVIIWSGKEP